MELMPASLDIIDAVSYYSEETGDNLAK